MGAMLAGEIVGHAMPGPDGAAAPEIRATERRGLSGRKRRPECGPPHWPLRPSTQSGSSNFAQTSAYCCSLSAAPSTDCVGRNRQQSVASNVALAALAIPAARTDTYPAAISWWLRLLTISTT